MVDWRLRRAEVDGGDAPVAPRPWRGWLWPRLDLGRLGEGSGGAGVARRGRIFRRRLAEEGHRRRRFRLEQSWGLVRGTGEGGEGG